MDKELTAKVVVVGDISVGKTCLLLRFTDNKFPVAPVATIGNDFKQRSVQIGARRIKLQVWDTAGQERYKSLTSRFFRGSSGVILMFDVTNRKSFFGIQNWLEDLDYHKIDISRCLLVGNKIDMSTDRVIDSAEATHFAKRHGMDYIETSVKEDINVQKAFVTIATQMMSTMKDTENTVSADLGNVSCKVELNYHNDVKKKKECSC